MTTRIFVNSQISPETRARLLDRDQVAAAYAERTIKQAAKFLGAGQKSMEQALDYHGIPRRQRGQRAPGAIVRLTRADVARAARRAYLRANRCPPNCPGRDQCLDPRGHCVFKERTLP